MDDKANRIININLNIIIIILLTCVAHISAPRHFEAPTTRPLLASYEHHCKSNLAVPIWAMQSSKYSLHLPMAMATATATATATKATSTTTTPAITSTEKRTQLIKKNLGSCEKKDYEPDLNRMYTTCDAAAAALIVALITHTDDVHLHTHDESEFSD